MGDFCEGYASEPFRSLCRDYPDGSVYPSDSFRVEWGPIFHRGRLDGSARALIIGQDPATHESISRRILVGEAGQRVQGFLARLGYTRSYTLINTFLYSVFGQGGGEKHKDDAGIIAYRHKWFSALLAPGSKVEVVIALGRLAKEAWETWCATPNAHGAALPFAAMTHPTKPESASGGSAAKLKEEIAAMLSNWNQAIDTLQPHVKNADQTPTFTKYGSAFVDGDLAGIPDVDLPAGIPPWMRALDAWASRKGETPAEKRRTIVVKVPKGVIP